MPTDMKEQIAHATEVLIMEKNVKRLTVKDIVEECHITRQTFYYHFEDIPHLLQWTMVRGLEKMRKDAKGKGGFEERLRYVFKMAAQNRIYIERTLASNYGEELERIMQRELMRLTEELADSEHLYQDLPREETKIVMQYHVYAIMGLLWEWSDAPPEQVDRVVHTICRIMKGKIALSDELY